MDLLSLIVSETAEYAGVSVCCSGGSIGGRRVQRTTLFPRSNVDVMMQSREYVTNLYFLAALSLKKKKEVSPGTRLASLTLLTFVGAILALRPMFDASQSMYLKVRYLESTSRLLIDTTWYLTLFFN